MDEITKALKEVILSVGEYLPPDGISKDELINRVIYATDNPEFNEAWLLHQRDFTHTDCKSAD